jgi:hypothetical protein
VLTKEEGRGKKAQVGRGKREGPSGKGEGEEGRGKTQQVRGKRRKRRGKEKFFLPLPIFISHC